MVSWTLEGSTTRSPPSLEAAFFSSPGYRMHPAPQDLSRLDNTYMKPSLALHVSPPSVSSSSIPPLPQSTGGSSLLELANANFQSSSGVIFHWSAISRVTIAVKLPPFPFPRRTQNTTARSRIRIWGTCFSSSRFMSAFTSRNITLCAADSNCSIICTFSISGPSAPSMIFRILRVMSSIGIPFRYAS